MDRESIERMKLDRRLARRRGWIGRERLERELSELPDSAAKATTVGEADASGAPPSPAAGAPEAGAPLASERDEG